MEMEMDVLATTWEIQLIQEAGKLQAVTPPPGHLPSSQFSSIPHIFSNPLLHLPNNLHPRGEQPKLALSPNYPWAQETLQLFGEVGPSAEQEVQQQLSSLGVKWLKSFKLTWKTKEGEFRCFRDGFSHVDLEGLVQKLFHFFLFKVFWPGTNLPRTSAEHSLLGRWRTNFRLTSIPRGPMQNASETQTHWSFWLDCLVYGLNDWQFDSWQTDTDWSISA